MRTYFPKQGDIEPKWFIIDAEGKVLGRLSTEIARIISGKSKPTYTPFLDTGDHVIVINAEKILLTGKKETDNLPSPLALSGRPQREGGPLRPRRQAGVDDRARRSGHAAEEQARPEDDQKVEGLSRYHSPPRRSEARAARSRLTGLGGFIGSG